MHTWLESIENIKNSLTCGFGDSWASDAGQAGPCAVLFEQKKNFWFETKQSKIIDLTPVWTLCGLEMRLFPSAISLWSRSFKKKKKKEELLLDIQESVQNIFYARVWVGIQPDSDTLLLSSQKVFIGARWSRGL